VQTTQDCIELLIERERESKTVRNMNQDETGKVMLIYWSS
jgi:hypothetical protein